MAPIEGVSDIRRLPRLGKIRLGIKKEGSDGPYPKAVDYFVCPEEVKAVYGEKPVELKIMFPSDDIEIVAPQYYKCYSYSQGLICRGTGKTSRRKVDVRTGDFANRDTKEWELADGNCDPDDCPKLAQKQCRKVMSLRFLLPDVPGLGVYQLDTSSFYSILNVNSQIAPDGFLRPFTKGRISFIPLILAVGPQEVNPPGEGRKTVHVLKLWSPVKLSDLIRISRQKVVEVLLPGVDEEEPPGDLFPEEIIGGPKTGDKAVAQIAAPGESANAQAETGAGEKTAPAENKAAPTETEEVEGKSADDVTEEDVPDINALFRICFRLWKNKDQKPMQPLDVAKELGHTNVMDLYASNTSPWKAFLTIKEARKPLKPQN